MKKDSYERLNDWFINLYEESLFAKCFEYSAVLIWELFWYKVYPNIERKSGFVFLECGFLSSKLEEITQSLENKWYGVRIVQKSWNIISTFWLKKLERSKENLLELKSSLIKFY